MVAGGQVTVKVDRRARLESGNSETRPDASSDFLGGAVCSVDADAGP